MRREVKNKAASVRARLRNLAKADAIDFDALLLRYFQERLLYRLATSEFSDRFVLKGGLLLVGLKIPRSRATKDIDLLAERIGNDTVELERAFGAIADVSCDDGVKFYPSTITTEGIKEDTDYEGIRLKIDASLEQARKKLQIDIGFGDVIVPEARTMVFPTLLEEEPPRIKVYSLESIIAEKFEAMIRLAMANSRMKDFYDVYTLSVGHDFRGAILRDAIESTFRRRTTPMPEDPLIFRGEFHQDAGRQQQWIAFQRKARLQDPDLEFEQVTKRITIFLTPVVQSVSRKERFERSWDSKAGSWKK
jgi:predicted nucleotidyltransferase component of viral defense system